MKILGNFIWLLFGGIFIVIHYFISSIALIITIIGIPFGIQTLKLAAFALWPFGKQAVTAERSSGCLYILMNIFWILTGGLWICIHHVLWGIFFTITIIGIPFAVQHFKLAGLALTPFGKDIIKI
jgi:uncharacterized membrane protein YccF (DUF307 family)